MKISIRDDEPQKKNKKEKKLYPNDCINVYICMENEMKALSLPVRNQAGRLAFFKASRSFSAVLRAFCSNLPF